MSLELKSLDMNLDILLAIFDLNSNYYNFLYESVLAAHLLAETK